MIVAFFLRLLPFAHFIGAAMSVIGVMLWLHHSGAVAEQNKTAKTTIKQIEKNDKIKAEIMGLSCLTVHGRVLKYYRD